MFGKAWELLTYRLKSKQAFHGRTEALNNEALGVVNSPEASALEAIIKHQHCPPLSCNDLCYFCYHVEFTAENLLFHLDYLNYIRQWECLSEEERTASPIIISARSKRLNLLNKHDGTQQVINVLKVEPQGSSLESVSTCSTLDVSSPPSYSTLHNAPEQVLVVTAPNLAIAISDVDTKYSSEIRGNEVTQSQVEIDSAQESERDRLMCTTVAPLPLRTEIDRLIAVYLRSNSTHELNLSDAMRKSCLRALGNTSHPSALQPVADHVHMLLCRSTIPNFLHYASRNANRPRRWYAFAISILTLLIVFALTVHNVVQKKPKWLRAIGIPSLWFGTTCLLAACRGSCFILALERQVQFRPYHAAVHNNSDFTLDFEVALVHTGTIRQLNAHPKEHSGVVSWRKKSLFRKIFSQTQTTAGLYRHMQDAMVLQCIVQGLLITIICTLIVVLIPVLD